MDPKMDSGYLQTGESLEADYDLAQPLTAVQIVGLMDKLLTYETAWQQGHSLAQTVFTCLYIDKLLWPVPRTLSDANFYRDAPLSRAGKLVDIVLRAYCCAVVKTCDLIQTQITSQQYYEEEDFSGHLYRRELLTRISVAEIIQLLESAEACVAGLQDVDQVVQNALQHRLHLRRELLSALAADIPDDHIEPCASWALCQELIGQVESSTHSGVEVPDAFSEKVQRKLASTTPPRPIVEISLPNALNHLKRMCDDAKRAFSVLHCTTASGVITFLVTYMSKKPQPNVYVRCLMQALIYKDSMFLGTTSDQDFIFRDLAESVLGDSRLIHSSDDAQTTLSPVNKVMRTFAEATAHSFADLSRCLCMNRSRTRRMLSHTLNDWENLQFEAEDVDVRLREHTGEKPLIDRLGAGEEIWSYPLSSWVYAYKLKQMEWIIQLGFELDVYMSDELPAMFWYLRYLASTRYQHLSRVQTFANRSFDFIRKPTAKQTAIFRRTFANIEFAMTEANATAAFAEALSSLYQALRLTQLLHEPPRPYGTADFRHNLRLKPFLTVSLPAVPSRDEVLDALENRIQALSIGPGTRYARPLILLDSAEELLKIARKDWDTICKQPADVAQCTGFEAAWRSKSKDVLKSVISAGITIAGLKQVIAKAGDGCIDGVEVQVPEAGYHEWWPVPTLKSK